MKRKRGTGRNLREPPAQGSKRLSLRLRATADIINPATQPEPPLAHRFYTQCPRCKTFYRISVGQLRSGRGIAECQQCQESFNVLERLADTTARAQTEAMPARLVRLGQLDAVAIPALESAESGFSNFQKSPYPFEKGGQGE